MIQVVLLLQGSSGREALKARILVLQQLTSDLATSAFAKEHWPPLQSDGYSSLHLSSLSLSRSMSSILSWKEGKPAQPPQLSVKMPEKKQFSSITTTKLSKTLRNSRLVMFD